MIDQYDACESPMLFVLIRLALLNFYHFVAKPQYMLALGSLREFARSFHN